MKKWKVDFRLIIAILVCLCFGNVIVFLLQGPGLSYENALYDSYETGKQKLTTKRQVYIITIPTDDDALSQKEKSKLEQQRLEELKFLAGSAFRSASGVFILGTELLDQPVNERECMPAFRDSGNVFWHYSMKNISYYHVDDKCGQIKYIDSSTGGFNRFCVMGEGKYDRNFASYYMMCLGENKVSYDEKKHEYQILEPSGEKKVLHAFEDGTVKLRKTSSYEVQYYSIDEIYDLIHAQLNLVSMFKNSVVLIQDDKPVSEYDKASKSQKTLADYYLDVYGTIENAVTVPIMTKTGVMILVSLGILLVGLIVISCPLWLSILLTLVVMGGMQLLNMFLFRYDIYYIPVVLFQICIFGSLVLLLLVKMVLGRINVKNLPIDAVIRFTNTIVNIEHSISYAEYLMKNRVEIENDISASLLLPVMDDTSYLLKELSEENHRNRRFVDQEFWDANVTGGLTSSVIQTRSNLFQGVRYIAFVPLPVFDVESEITTYTVIGLKKKLKVQNASYISMMLFSMYIYFKAQHERGEHQRMYLSMLALMISVIDAKDPVTAGHSQRVANIAKDIGIWMQLSKKDQIDLEFAALLHDVGKIGVSDYVLNKPSVYTQNDFEQMKYHTIRGAEMLSEVGISERIIDGVRHHHERMDGKGYPDGLKGDELSDFAKILKIADVFDALTSKRQYKEEWEIEKAINIIYRGRGTEFDTKIADVFIEHMSPPGWIPPIDENMRRVERKDPNANRAVEIFRDFYDRYEEYLSVEYPISSKKAKKVDFSYRSGFMHYDWGETFNNATFLEDKPMILAYEKETKSLLFGQGSKDSNVHSIYYYFFKGFVNMGVFLLEQEKVKETLATLSEIYGEAQVIDSQTMIYPAMKMRVVFYRTDDERCLLFYISDYMCNNYVMIGKRTDTKVDRA